MANALTALRVLLTVPFAFLMTRGDRWSAAPAGIVLVPAAFAQYVVDSYWGHRGRALRTSGLGRWNGVLYFAPLGGDVLVRLGLGAFRPVVSMVAWTLVLSTVISMPERLWALRAARGSPAGETGARRRR